MTHIATVPLVGLRFHPPASAVLAALPAGVPLILVPDPENPWDHYAIKVFVDPKFIPHSQHDELALRLPGFGMTLSALLAEPCVMLGFVAMTHSESLARAITEARGVANVSATLGFTADGKPQVQVTIAEPAPSPQPTE